MFENQRSKVWYTPKFDDQGEGQWWQWLVRASEHFETVGDKMAFSDEQLRSLNVDEFMEFFEARFFRSKYIFIFRNPLQCVLSAIGLWNRAPAAAVAGWCEFVKLWADFIRIFPSTMTVLLEQLDSDRVGEIGEFLSLDLRRAPGCSIVVNSAGTSRTITGAENSSIELRRCFR